MSRFIGSCCAFSSYSNWRGIGFCSIVMSWRNLSNFVSFDVPKVFSLVMKKPKSKKSEKRDWSSKNCQPSKRNHFCARDKIFFSHFSINYCLASNTSTQTWKACAFFVWNFFPSQTLSHRQCFLLFLGKNKLPLQHWCSIDAVPECVPLEVRELTYIPSLPFHTHWLSVHAFRLASLHWLDCHWH